MVTSGRPRSARLVVVGLVAVSLAIITMDYRQGSSGPLADAGAAAQAGMAPLQEAVSTVTRPIGRFFTGLANLPSLASENEELRRQVLDYQTQITITQEQANEIEALRELLGLKQTLDPGGIPAVVIGNGVSNFDWTVTINKGRDEGVEPGMPVIAGSAQSPRLVGHVIGVTPVSADVELILDPSSAVAGVLSTSRKTGLVHGAGQDDLRMDLVTPGTEIDIASEPVQVFTVSYEVNGHQGLYPPGILIGEVSRVYEGSNQLYQAVSVRPAVDFSALEYVLVLRSHTLQADEETP